MRFQIAVSTNKAEFWYFKKRKSNKEKAVRRTFLKCHKGALRSDMSAETVAFDSRSEPMDQNEIWIEKWDPSWERDYSGIYDDNKDEDANLKFES